MNRRSLLTFGRRSGFVRAGRRRGVQVVALLSAGMLVVSGLSITALTAGIQTTATAIGQPAHDMHEDGVRRRGPVPRAAFPALPARGPAVFGGDRVYDIDVNGTSYRVHEFTTVGSGSLTVTRSIDVEYLVVAGGGGGGSGAASDHAGGGGGAGGVLHGTLKLSGSSTVPVVVGSGGSGGGDGGAAGARAAGSNGGNSAFADVVAVGGGGGGNSATNGGDGANEGGSGGGGAALVASLGTTQTGQGAAGTSGQGNKGGDGETASSPKKAGGGGGATAAGASGASSSAGGQGFSSSITGTSRVYGAGGGGGRDTKSGAGGSFTGPGMGGAVENRGAGTPGAAGSGAGGGGGSGGGGSAIDAGGAGGSGIVVVRYQIPRTTWASVGVTGGDTVTDTTIDGELYREHRFTGTGNHTLALSIENPSTQLEVLMVGGGGGGGADSGGGGGGGALLEGRITFAEAGDRTLTVTVGEGGARGRWTGPSGFAGKGGSSVVSMQRGATTEFMASVEGGVGGPNNDRNATNTNEGNNTGAGGVSPPVPALSGGATWQTVQSKSGGAGGPASGPGYETRPRDGQPAPIGGGESTLFGGSFGGGGGGGSSASTVTAPGTRGGGRGSGNSSGCAIELRATPGQPNTGGGGGGGAAYGDGDGCTDSAGLNTRDGEPGGSGIVVIRYPLSRTITALPTAIRELVAAEGNTTAQLRFKPPTNDPPAVNSSGYKIEYSPVSGATWTTVTTPVTFTTTGSGATQVITADVTGIPSGSRHRFRVTPIGTVEGPSATTEPIAKGGDIVKFVGDEVVHQYTTVGNANFALSEPRTVDALVVGGGGGGGGSFWGGGGGGGRVLHGQSVSLDASNTIPVTVGGGGAGGKLNPATPAERTGSNGGASAFNGVTAAGGGGGGGAGWNIATYVGQGSAGGSGGGTGEHGNTTLAHGQLLYETSNPTRNASSAIVYRSGFGNGATDAAATFDNAGNTISTVSYRMEVSVDGVTRFAETRFDSWTGLTARDLRVPDLAGGNEFTLHRFVENLSIDSNMTAAVSPKSQGVVTGSGRVGYLEIWPRNYGPTNRVGGPSGADDLVYDFNDTPWDTGTYGSFQVHDVTTSGQEQTVIAWNQHAHDTPDIGLGNHTGDNPDWTFSVNNSLRTSNTGAWKLEIRVNKDPIRTVSGGAATATAAPAGWVAYGEAGGAVHVVMSQAGSGGGGASAAGGDVPLTSNQTINGVWQPRVAGNGGAGRAFAITGVPTTYGGGGGGATSKANVNDVCSQGGSGGGGAGTCGATAATAGVNGVGGGGGGGQSAAGQPGGSGTVIVRYALASVPSVQQLAAAETFTSATLRFVEPAEDAPDRTAESYQIAYAPLGQDNWTVITPTSFSASGSGVITATVAPPQNADKYQFRVAPIVSTAQGVLVGPGRVVASAGKGGDTLTVMTSNSQTYFVHSFTQTGTTSFAISEPLAVEYLVVAGGGGGGYGNANEGGGGGGAGGLLTNLGAPSTIGSGGPQSFPVTVGAGGAGATETTTSATSGQNSVFASWTAAGGGGGGSCSSSARQGGSGGGGSGCSGDRPGATASPAGQGNNGGSGQWIQNGPGNGGGGGGAGGAGGNGSARSGPSTGGGGAGAANTITGSSVVYAAGGHGFEGRGNRVETRGVGLQGTDGLGNGGAGSAQQNGARGGSGIVVIRYVIS